MADDAAEGQQDQQQSQDNAGGGSEGAAAVERHQAIPENYFKAESGYDYDAIGSALGEAATLKAAAEDRAKQIPAKPDDYKFELPRGFELPGGYKWEANPTDPVVAGFRTLASDLKLTQPEVQKLVAFEATRQANEIKAQGAFDAEQTKALGANAEQRRTDLKGRIAASTTPERAAVLNAMLKYAGGVEALEDIFSKAGIAPRGNAGDQQHGDAKKAALIEQVGKPGGASAILRAAHKG
jgi:hypothetical protein